MRKNRQPLTASLLTLSTFVVTATAWSTSATAAEVCYQDDIGRIVKRRRPGYTEVPCPEEGSTQRQTPAGETPAGESPAGVAPSIRQDVPLPPQEDTGRAPRRRAIERTPPPSVSPIPRPDLTDYVESVAMPDRWRIVDSLGYEENAGSIPTIATCSRATGRFMTTGFSISA